MKRTFATYEHSTIGFPAIKLKWQEEDGLFTRPYLVIKGTISDNTWNWRNLRPEPFISAELALFDDWVRMTYGNDASFQG